MPKGKEYKYVTKNEFNNLNKGTIKQVKRLEGLIDENKENLTDTRYYVFKDTEKITGDVVDLDKRLRIQEKLKKLDGKKGPVKFKKASTKLKPTRSKAKKKAVLKKPAKSRSKSWWEY